MTMYITGTIVSIRMRTHDRLIARKYCSCNFHTYLLRTFWSESVFSFIIRIKADDIVVGLDLVIRADFVV